MTILTIGKIYKGLGEFEGINEFDGRCAECGKKVNKPNLFWSDSYGTTAIGKECIKKIELIEEV